MLNRIQTTTGVVTGVVLTLTFIYHQTSLNTKNLSNSSSNHYDFIEYSSELNKLRHDINDLKKTVCHLEQSLSSSTFSKTIFSSIQTVVSNLTFISSSFLLYLFFLYLFHICVLNTSTGQTMKLLHIVNIISYSLVSIFYKTFQHSHSSNITWLCFVLLLVRFCIR